MLKKLSGFLLNNHSRRQTIAKNTFWLFLGNIGSKLIRSVLIIAAARMLGAREWGTFSYALSIATLFTIFTDFGLNAVITRESTRDLEKQNEYFITALVAKACIAVVITIVVIAISPTLLPYLTNADDAAVVAAVLPVVMLISVFDALRDFAASLSRAWEKMEIESIIQLTTNVVIVAVGLGALWIAPTSRSLGIGYAAGTGIGMIAAFYPFRRYFADARKQFSPKLLVPLLKSSWPFGMTALMGVVMLNTDSVMIGRFLDVAQVGLYSAGQRVIMLLFSIPVIVATAFFPSFSKLAIDPDRNKLKTTLEKSIGLMGLLAIPLTVGGVLLGRAIVNTLFGGEYDGAVLAFQVMCLTLIPVFFATILNNAVFAIDKEEVLLPYIGIGVIGNFLFNLLLIPIAGIAGAATSTVITQTASAAYLYAKAKKYTRMAIARYLVKPLIATGVMGVSIKIAGVWWPNMYAQIILGVLVFSAAILILKDTLAKELFEGVLGKLKTRPEG